MSSSIRRTADEGATSARRILAYLRLAATGQNVPRALHDALRSIAEIDSGSQITKDERHDLLFALGRAFEAAASMPPGAFFTEDLNSGFAAVAALVTSWAEDPACRSFNPDHAWDDLQDAAHILRNHAQNAVLAARMAERRFQRLAGRSKLKLAHNRDAER